MEMKALEIGAWVAPPHYGDKNFINDEQFRLLKESGISMIYSLYEHLPQAEKDVKQTLALCEKYGLRYLVIDDDFSLKGEGTGKNAHIYKDSAAFAGILVCDEPGIEHFKKLRQLKDNFDKIFTDKLFYVNTLPSYAQADQLSDGAVCWSENGSPSNEKEYLEYIGQYIQKVRPEVLSLDYYPMEGAFPRIKEGHFKQLSVAQSHASRNHIPLWVFIQLCSWNDGVRIPNEGEILWQISTALAYGVKGIQYFTYFLPLEVSAGTCDVAFTGSMVDEQGRKTPIYDIVSRANEHLHAVGDILSESNFCGIQVFGESPIEVPKTDLERGSMIENISGGNFLCGKLERGGKEVDYIVNLSIENAAEAQIKFADTREHSFCVGDKTGVACGGVRIPLKAGEGALVY